MDENVWVKYIPVIDPSKWTKEEWEMFERGSWRKKVVTREQLLEMYPPNPQTPSEDLSDQ